MSPRQKKAATIDDATLADIEANAVRAAQAIVTLLPATSDLAVGVPQPPALVDASAWAGAAVAPLAGSKDAKVGVLVGADLVTALAESPMGPLELGAALQPSLDAAANALGTTAGAGSTVGAAQLAEAIEGATVAVPLVAGNTTAAVLLVTTDVAASTPKPAAAPAPGTVRRPGIELLHGVAMDVTVELGRTRLSVRELLALTPGDVLELDRAAGSPADLLVNGRLIARGEVVVVDENFALRVTEIVANSAAS
jgi:flagellar motor switch protein FliN/FliY